MVPGVAWRGSCPSTSFITGENNSCLVSQPVSLSLTPVCLSLNPRWHEAGRLVFLTKGPVLKNCGGIFLFSVTNTSMNLRHTIYNTHSQKSIMYHRLSDYFCAHWSKHKGRNNWKVALKSASCKHQYVKLNIVPKIIKRHLIFEVKLYIAVWHQTTHRWQQYTELRLNNVHLGHLAKFTTVLMSSWVRKLILSRST